MLRTPYNTMQMSSSPESDTSQPKHGNIFTPGPLTLWEMYVIRMDPRKNSCFPNKNTHHDRRESFRAGFARAGFARTNEDERSDRREGAERIMNGCVSVANHGIRPHPEYVHTRHLNRNLYTGNVWHCPRKKKHYYYVDVDRAHASGR
jgi:hypothetical protein